MKKKNRDIFLNILAWCLVVLVPLGFFLLLLSIQFPESMLTFINDFQMLFYLLFIVLFYFSFRLSAKWSWLAGLTLTMLLFAYPLTYKWSLGLSATNFIGGFIPYKDGIYYYNSARMLLIGQLIPKSAVWGAFRPIFASFLSVLLFLTNHNLLWTLAIITFIDAFGCYLAAREVDRLLGHWPAALFIMLLHLFLQNYIGWVASDLLSYAFGCLAFVLLVRSAQTRNFRHIILGSLVLVIAISVGAGPFFIFPLLILWIGCIYRTGKKLSFPKMGIYALILIIAFLTVNLVFPRLVVEPGTALFGTFSWHLYGQAVGGAGFAYSFQALGTNDPQVILPAAIEKIIHYPLGMVIASIKSYRDFFSPNRYGIFYINPPSINLPFIIYWLICSILFLLGVIHILRNSDKPVYALFLFILIGIVLSIPFLPPIDGGRKYHSGSAPFFFVLVAIGLYSILSRFKFNYSAQPTEKNDHFNLVSYLSVLLIFMALIAPLLVRAAHRKPEFKSLVCPTGEIPYAFQMYTGTYIDILPQAANACGHLPELCLADFDRLGADKVNDDFFRLLVDLTSASSRGIRVTTANDLISSDYYYFVGPLELLSASSSQSLISGCAKVVKTQFQQALLIQSIDS